MPTVMCVLFEERVRLEVVIGWKRDSSQRRSSTTALHSRYMLLVTSYRNTAQYSVFRNDCAYKRTNDISALSNNCSDNLSNCSCNYVIFVLVQVYFKQYDPTSCATR